ncbi:hypothetical protein [Snodgrassella alvi]|uniref:hypothetical protein n=1 Tax=Snodgrassella alvi TaxID=1196083 RepID=UPI0034611409
MAKADREEKWDTGSITKVVYFNKRDFNKKNKKWLKKSFSVLKENGNREFKSKILKMYCL